MDTSPCLHSLSSMSFLVWIPPPCTPKITTLSLSSLSRPHLTQRRRRHMKIDPHLKDILPYQSNEIHGQYQDSRATGAEEGYLHTIDRNDKRRELIYTEERGSDDDNDPVKKQEMQRTSEDSRFPSRSSSTLWSILLSESDLIIFQRDPSRKVLHLWWHCVFLRLWLLQSVDICCLPLPQCDIWFTECCFEFVNYKTETCHEWIPHARFIDTVNASSSRLNIPPLSLPSRSQRVSCFVCAIFCTTYFFIVSQSLDKMSSQLLFMTSPRSHNFSRTFVLIILDELTGYLISPFQLSVRVY